MVQFVDEYEMTRHVVEEHGLASHSEKEALTMAIESWCNFCAAMVPIQQFSVEPYEHISGHYEETETLV